MADLLRAIRALRGAPGFTAVALVVLTLGIGASTAIFAVVDAVVLRGLPFDQADRLMSVSELLLESGTPTGTNTPQNFIDWRAGQQVFDGLAAVAGGSGYILRDGGEAVDIRTRRVTHELFPVLRVPPHLGGTFTAAHEVDGEHRVAVLSYGFWQQQFGGDPNVVGRRMTLDNGTYEVIGVMPAGFTYPVGAAQPPQMFVPYLVPPSERVRGNSRSYYLSLVGRLRPGVSIEQARAQIEQITEPLAAATPTWFAGKGISIRPLHAALVGRVRPWMLLLLGVVAFVLSIACVNVANLMLARATAREREFSIRAAMGASRWQLARGLLIESLVLSLAGAALGTIVAVVGADVLRSAMPPFVPRLSNIAIDLRVLGVSALAATVTGLLFGLIPAIQSSRPDLTHALRDGGRATTAGVARQRLRSVLVVAEVALAVVLLIGSGLFVSSFARVMSIDLGFDHRNLLTMQVPLGSLQRLNDTSEADRTALAGRNMESVDALLETIARTPGVDSFAIHAGALPLSGNSIATTAKAGATSRTESVELKGVSPGYHQTFRIPLRAGRLFNADDRTGGAPVVILNEVAAATLFDGQSAIGQIVTVNGDRTVVGIVGAVRQSGPETPAPPEAYVPLSQATIYDAELTVRTSGDPMAALPGVKQTVMSVLPTAVFPTARTMEGLLDGLVAQRRFNMTLFSLFGLLGLVIASVGIYGVMAFIVEQRTAEFGVRMALGAQRSRILGMVLRRAAIMMAAGLFIGMGIAWACARFVRAFLFEITPADPIVYLGGAGLLTLVGLIAALVPAFRASRVDPIVALRAQ